ncbi:MAG TPA: hypothetical protein VEU62_22295 [Bryobacterales bacterium]|nr:hypothetical protein [Bryobacterales bacterium]
MPLGAQREQLGPARKGRLRETGRPRPSPANVSPEHTLPRRLGPVEIVAPPNPDELERQRQRAALPPEPPLAEDRTYRLVRRTPSTAAPSPLPPPSLAVLYPLPRPIAQPESFAGVLPSFVIPSPYPEPAAVPSRWRIGFPAWQRYDNTKLDTVYARQRWWDPFNQNVVKGDYPIFGRKNFLNFSGLSDTLVESRRLPVASDVSSASPGSFDFFGRGGQVFVSQNFRLTFDLFRGSAGFRPVDFEVRFTPEFNINYLLARENGITDIDVRQGIRRTDNHVGAQELFYEMRLHTNSASAFRPRENEDQRGSAYFDFTSIRLGIQRFTSDFRGFIFSDEQPGARLFGNFGDNRFQYNLAYFNLLEKDTNSGLNTTERRHQSVYISNLYWQDFLTHGYTAEFSLLYNNDQPTFHLDKNGFLVRPARIGDPRPHKIRAAYAGFAGDGHIGRLNVSHAFYQAFGRDDYNPIPAMHNPQHINAQLVAAEFSYDRDWLRYKASFFYTSGDKDINDGKARGFDSIVDNQNFAGGGFLNNGIFADRGQTNPLFEGGGTNFFNRESIPLTGTGVQLVSFNSLMPTLRSSKEEGQANFINPGIMIFNAGLEAKLTPKLRSQFNANYMRFVRTEVLEALLFQSGIRHAIGWDYGLGVQYRPLLSENVVITTGLGVLQPGDGFKNIYTSRVLYSGFLQVRLLF